MTLRKELVDMLVTPRTASSLARELGLKRGDIEEELAHAIRSARAAGHAIGVEPAKCRKCGFTFDADKLSKPGKCPECRSTWLYEPLISIRGS
jgi:predicted Zn-ribbon and HTH transcriptional regulator